MICSHQLAAQSCVTQQFHRRSTDTLLHKELHDASGQQQQPQQQADGKAKEGLSQRHAQSISGGSRGGEASLLRHRPGSIEAAEAALVAREESMQRPPQLLQQPNKVAPEALERAAGRKQEAPRQEVHVPAKRYRAGTIEAAEAELDGY